MKRGTVVSLFVALVVLALAGAAGAAIAPDQIKQSVAAEAWAAENPQACALLDSPKAASLMDGLLLKLAVLCGRGDLLGGVLAEEGEMPGESRDVLGVDVLVNNPATDSGSSRTQSETSVARNETTGVLCSGYNDSFHGVTQGTGYTGFSSSTDGGATWTDHGAIGAASFGDPSVFWRRSDGHFYIGAIHSSGMGLWDLGTDCTTVAFKSVSHSSSGDDKELYAVDNNPANAHYGRIYMAWTDFNAGGRIFGTFSDNGTTWSAPVALSGSTDDYQGAWPAVAPNGDIYVTWVKWAPYPTGPLDVELVRSTNGGVSYAPVTSPATGKVNPQAATPTSSCGRPALNGNIRYLPSPQVAVGPDGAVHVVYSYDPDGLNTGDVINVYYRRSTNNGTSWDTEVRLNDDATTRDQFFPSVSVGATNIVSAAWYDRRDDAGNLNFKYYQRMSFNGGVTWGASAPLSDVASPVILDPNLATCYHGDYDTQIQSSTAAVIVWADDRTVTLADPNVWNDTVAISTDFLVTSDPVTRSVCAPTAATYTVNVLQFSGFTEPVTLAATGNPAGSTVGFSANPVTPPGTSTMTVGTAGVATGSSTITVTGTSSPSAIVHSTDVTLSVFAGAPAAANLTAPANGAINIPLRPAFTWTAAAGAEDYLLEVASDPGFATIVYTATVAGTTQTPGTDLPSNTHLYWRVTANNPCGTMVSTVFNFSTVALPGDCAVGSVPNVLYDYGFEAGAGGWTHSGTGDSWAISTTSPHSGTSHFHANDPAVVSDQRLVSPAVVLPTGQNPVVIKFWHTPNLEPSGATACYDGGILEVSTNGGTTWTQVLAASILVGPYTGTVSSSFGNPLAGLQAWCGTSAYMQSIADITAYAGETAQFRLRLGSDSSVTLPGWNVDDVVVQSCQLADTMPFIDGFESGDTSAWSSTLP